MTGMNTGPSVCMTATVHGSIQEWNKRNTIPAPSSTAQYGENLAKGAAFAGFETKSRDF